MKKKLRSFIFSLIFLGISSLFALVLSEGMLRTFKKHLPEGVQLQMHWQAMGAGMLRSIAHPVTGFLYPANETGTYNQGELSFTFNTDHNGFRNKDPWPVRSDIVVVGDSLAFGYGVDDEDAWTEQVKRKLPGLSIMNLALIGSSPQQYQRVFETFGLPFRPKLLIVGLFPENDFWDAEKFDQWQKLGAPGNYDAFRLMGHDSFDEPKTLKSILKKTYSYALLKESISAYRERRAFQGKTLTFPDGKSQLQLVPGRLKEQLKFLKPGMLGFDLAIQALSNLNKITSETSTQILVLFFPSKEAVYIHELDPAQKDILLPLKKELDGLGIRYLDLTPPLQASAENGEKVFFKVDGHPNHRGYEIITQTIVRYLEENEPLSGLKRHMGHDPSDKGGRKNIQG